MRRQAKLTPSPRVAAGEGLTPEHEVILELIEPGNRVLDLGCGEGHLLQALMQRKGVRAEGLDLSEECLQACVAKGVLNVQRGDLEEGLGDYADQSVDWVLLTNTLPVLRRPLHLLAEMARVGRRCAISFPNFAHWSARVQLALGGHMPRTARLPYEWYDTPNIHLTTLRDFRLVCGPAGLEVLRCIPLITRNGHCRPVRLWPNLRADQAVFVVRRAERT